jgi:hypothetical protein
MAPKTENLRNRENNPEKRHENQKENPLSVQQHKQIDLRSAFHSFRSWAIALHHHTSKQS